jgi:hypothetical protein
MPPVWAPATLQGYWGQLGINAPLTQYLEKEVAHLQDILKMATEHLELVQVMCKTDGTFQDHPQELQKLALALLTSRVPAEWEEYWISPSVFTWFDGLAARHAQLRHWVQSGMPKGLWLGGLQDAAGLLMALKLEVVRAHPNDDEWSIEKLHIRTELTQMTVDDVCRPPHTGVYLSGLYTDTFIWSADEGTIYEAPDTTKDWQGTAHADLPLVHLTVSRNPPSPGQLYSCPVYANPLRSKWLCNIDLPCHEPPMHWMLRGAAVYAT